MSADAAHEHEPHIVVIGGGIAGLSAAFFLRDRPVRITVLESADKVGGQLSVSEVAGLAIDEGAEMTWKPKTQDLISAAGLGERLVLAANTANAIWTRGALRPLPELQFMGVPADMDQLRASGILSPAGMERARQDLEMPATRRDGDLSVASFVAQRQGQEVVERLVDPFLYEMCAGRSEELSFDATLTLLAASSMKFASIAEAAGSNIANPHPKKAGIATIVGGLGSLPQAMVDTICAESASAQVRTGTTVSALHRTPTGWQIIADTAHGPESIDADGVIVAVPAGAAGRLLAGVPGMDSAVHELTALRYASVVDVTLAYPRTAFAGGGLGDFGVGGYRVPEVDGGLVRSVTFSTVKWPHLAGEVEVVRCLAGRIGHEDDLLQRTDAELISQATAELAAATGAVGRPIETRVTRWPGAMPQYAVGHKERARMIRSVAKGQPGLALCGAAFDGVGAGHCMGSARKAVNQVMASVSTPPRRDTGALTR